MKKLAFGLLWVLLIPLLLPLVVIAVFGVLCASLYNWLWMRWFCWTRADRIYLICSRRRGWEPFLKNNAIPALPARVSAVWMESPQTLADVIHALRIAGVRHPRPFLALVTPYRVKSVPLNQRLLSLKKLGKTSPVAQAGARSIIDAVLANCGESEGPTVS